MKRAKYDRAFYQEQMAGSVRSAERLVPLVSGFITPLHSVCDVGCGAGTWLSVFMKHGASDVLGLDGDYVPREYLQIPPSSFKTCDLRQTINLGRTFDLALSLEVAEHLPIPHAERFVRDLTRLAPVVLFSAAIPNQGGTDHINEQWPDYWESLFHGAGYVPVDALRPRIWEDDRVEWWYRQNIFLYVRETEFTKYPALRAAAAETRMPRRVVHPVQFETAIYKPTRAAGIVSSLMRRVRAQLSLNRTLITAHQRPLQNTLSNAAASVSPKPPITSGL